jgi:hypothetical protein
MTEVLFILLLPVLAGAGFWWFLEYLASAWFGLIKEWLND